MPVSLATIVERIGLQRRKIAALHKGREEAYAALDAADQDLAKIQAKYTDGGEGDDGKSKEPTAEDVKAMGELEAKIVAGRKAILESNAAVAREETVLAQLEDDKSAREQHNRTEERLNASAGRSVDQGNLVGAAGTSTQIRVLPPTNEDLDNDLACLVRCVVQCRANLYDIPRVAAEQFGNQRLSAAMQANDFTAGGAFVPDIYMPRLIQGLFATAIVRSMGIPTVPIEFGSLSQPRITSGAVASYYGEGQDIAETSVGTDRMTLLPKELGGLLPISNTLLMQSSPGANQVMMDQLSIGMSLGEDRAFLRGPKAGAGPTGLRYLAGTVIATGTEADRTKPTVVEVEAFLGAMELALENADVPCLRLYYTMAPRVKKYLQNMRDANGNRIYPELSNKDNPSIRGISVKVTTSIPRNLGAGADSEIMLLDASQQMIGENPRINIAASTETSYKNAAGVMVSAFQRNETVLRMIMWNDINTQHPESIAVLTGVRWGA